MTLFIALLGTFVALLLFLYSSHTFKGNYFLFVYFLCNALWGFLYHGLFDGPYWLGAALNGHMMPFYYLVGPSLYLYIRSMIQDRVVLRWVDLIHVVPFLILLVGIIPYYTVDFDLKLQHIKDLRVDKSLVLAPVHSFISQEVNILSRHVLLLLYFSASAWLLFSNRKTILAGEQRLESHNIFVYRWLWVMVTMSFLITLLYLSYFLIIVDSESINDKYDSLDWMVQLMGLVYVAINGSLFFFPQILYGLPRAQKQLQEVSTETSAADPSLSSELVFSGSYMKKLEEALNRVEQEQLFLDPDFTMDRLVQVTGFPEHHLSRYLNYSLGISFPDWRNKLRIAIAEKMLLNGITDQYSMEYIATAVGFSGKSRFFAAFKKFKGLTPGQFIKNAGEQRQSAD
jgi:AraC-like DNA-binding protein